MAGNKKISYIEYEINWYEEKLKGMMDLVDANFPFSEIPDRTEVEPNAKGVPVIKVIAKKEEMIKVIKDILKDLPQMLQALNDLREKREAAKMETRGGKKIPGMMDKFIQDRGGS